MKQEVKFVEEFICKKLLQETDQKNVLWYGHLRRMETTRWSPKLWTLIPTDSIQRRGTLMKDRYEGVKEAIMKRRMVIDDWQNKKSVTFRMREKGLVSVENSQKETLQTLTCYLLSKYFPIHFLNNCFHTHTRARERTL